MEPALAPIVSDLFINYYCLTKSAHPILEPLHYLILIIALIINHRSVFDSDWCCFVLVKMNASYDACLEIRSWYMHIYCKFTSALSCGIKIMHGPSVLHI